MSKTGLSGKYDFELHWTPDPAQTLLPGAPAVEAQPADPNAPTIFTALQEPLGLRPESEKGPVDMIVIDRVEKPSEN
jgi:bla regulator protein blaR1